MLSSQLVDAIPTRPRRLNHVAYVMNDAAETTRFYQGVMGLPLVAFVIDDKIPSTGDEFPYSHLFFELGPKHTCRLRRVQSLGARRSNYGRRRPMGRSPSKAWRRLFGSDRPRGYIQYLFPGSEWRPTRDNYKYQLAP